MAKQNPRGSSVRVALAIPSRHRKFLHRVFAAARAGVRDELDRFPDRVRSLDGLRREEAAYEALLAALDSGAIVASGDVRCVLCDLAVTIDRENEYERVVAEHAALLDVRRQIGARR